jgi:hypothetical protein
MSESNYFRASQSRRDNGVNKLLSLSAHRAAYIIERVNSLKRERAASTTPALCVGNKEIGNLVFIESMPANLSPRPSSQHAVTGNFEWPG